MTSWRDAKFRSEETWLEVRRGWEGGETGASLARRYDVGLANLWRRRASEGWERRAGEDRKPEPLEGWSRYAERERDAFEARLAETRALALDLVKAMQGGPMTSAPLWHLGFLFAYRAQHLGPEVAAADRERSRGKPWAKVFWDAEGKMPPTSWLDVEIARTHPEEFRRELGLPDGAAPDYP